MTVAKQNPNSSQKTRWDLYIYRQQEGNERQGHPGRALGKHSRKSSPRTKSTIMIIVIPSYSIRCKTVVSTTAVRTQGLGADHKSRKGCGLGSGDGGMRVESGRTRTCRSGPYSSALQGTHLISAPKLGPGDDRVGSRADDMHVRSTFSTNLISSL